MYVVFNQMWPINNKHLNRETDIIMGNMWGVDASEGSCSGLIATQISSRQYVQSDEGQLGLL